jgi:hypothetical protein
MTHAEYGTLLAYVDGELDETNVSALESHLEACSGCREELADVRHLSDEASQALGLISAAPPIAEARARVEARIAAQRRRRFVPRWEFATAGLLKAAAVVLVVAGAASAAIPGSPVRRWAASLFDRTGDASSQTTQPQAVTPIEPQSPTQEPPATSVPMILHADAGRIRVSVHRTDPAADVTVRVVDGDEGQIRPVSDGTRFRSGEGYVDVYDISKGVLIEIPRDLAGATVEVDGRLIFRKEGASVRIFEPATEDPGGDYVFHGRS